MTADPDEPVLREAFRRLRAETESGRVPDFAMMIERARTEAEAEPGVTPIGDRSTPIDDRTTSAGRRRHRRVAIGGWVTLAAAAVAALLLVRSAPDADADFERLVASYASDRSTGAWRSPTAGLLDVPGMSLTRTTPAIGEPLRRPDPGFGSAAPARRDS